MEAAGPADAAVPVDVVESEVGAVAAEDPVGSVGVVAAPAYAEHEGVAAVHEGVAAGPEHVVVESEHVAEAANVTAVRFVPLLVRRSEVEGEAVVRCH